MRNLKKILAMALALVMSLSLMATAGAAETTAATGTSQYQTATDVLKGVKVIWGDEGGDRLQDTITRAEVAALLYRISTGDVTDSQKDLYTNHAFTDVNGIEWARGYISYCYNAEIIKGNPDGTFEPDENITGYATLAMILRAMGYGKNGEFVGDGWEIQTAATGERIGVLKNINQAQLGQPATREMVAEILFRAILTETVNFSALTPYNYVGTGETLAQKQFGLEQITGVIKANEWANLDSDTILAEGTTKMTVTEVQSVGATATVGQTVTLDKATELDAVGLTYNAYVAGKTTSKTTLTLEEGSNTVAYNEGKGVNHVANSSTKANGTSGNQSWASIEKLADEEGLSLTSDTEWYINYSDEWDDNVTSDIRISYAIAKETLNGLDSVSGNVTWKEYIEELKTLTNNGSIPSPAKSTYPGHYLGERTIQIDLNLNGTIDEGEKIDCWVIAIVPNNTINQIDLDIMQRIFYTADRIGANGTITEQLQNYAVGEVYAGTTSMKDYSDEMSWADFKAQFFTADVNSRKFDFCNIGNSLRIVDNNGDDKADYVLRVDYTQDKVVGTYKSELLCNSVALADYPEGNKRYSPDADELAQGVIVNYTVIDKKLSIWKADVVTDSITTKNFSNITVTTDSSDVYGQSGIDNYTRLDQNIMQMNNNTQYNMYLDEYGYIRSYELAQGSKYALLTEMYPTTDRNGNYVRDFQAIAEVKIADADVTEYPVTTLSGIYSGNGNDFFNSYIWTWGIRGWFNTGATSGSNNAIMGSQYYNANYLQPAVAHLGIRDVSSKKNLTVSENVWVGTTNNEVKYTSSWNRSVADMQARAAAYGNGTGGDYGVFDYGAESTAAHSFSFTNVAAYVDNGDTMTLTTASRLYTDQATGAQVYRVGSAAAAEATAGLSGDDAKKVDQFVHGTEAELVAAYRSAHKETTDTNGQAWFDKYIGAAYRNGTGIYPIYAEDYVQLDLTRDNHEKVLSGETLVVKPGIRHYHIDWDYNELYNTNSNTYVDATVDTEFYIVTPNSITYKVGYDELPNIKVSEIRAAYAVAHNTHADSDAQDYWVADVIVIETNTLAYDYDSIGLAFYNPYETNGYIRYADSLNNQWKALQPDYEDQAEMGMVPKDGEILNLSWGNTSWTNSMYGFYKLYNTEWTEPNQLAVGRAVAITDNYNKSGIYAGEVTRLEDLQTSGYLDVSTEKTGHAVDTYCIDVNYGEANQVPVYRIVSSGNGFDAVSVMLNPVERLSGVKLGDRIIWVYNKAQTEVAFVVVVEGTSNSVLPPWVAALYTRIIDDQKANTVSTIDLRALLDEAAALEQNANATTAEVNAMIAKLRTARANLTMTAAEMDELDDLVADLGAKVLTDNMQAAQNAAKELANQILLHSDASTASRTAVKGKLSALTTAIGSCATAADLEAFYKDGNLVDEQTDVKDLKDAVELADAKIKAIAVVKKYVEDAGLTTTSVSTEYGSVVSAIEACENTSGNATATKDVEYYVKDGELQNKDVSGVMKTLVDKVGTEANTAALTAAKTAATEAAKKLVTAGYEVLVKTELKDLTDAIGTETDVALLNKVAAGDWEATTGTSLDTTYNALVQAIAANKTTVEENEKIDEAVTPGQIGDDADSADVPTDGMAYQAAYQMAGVTVTTNDAGANITIDSSKFIPFMNNVGSAYTGALITMRPHDGNGCIDDAALLAAGVSFKAPDGASKVIIYKSVGKEGTDLTTIDWTDANEVETITQGASDFRNNGEVNIWTSIALGTDDTTVTGYELSDIRYVGDKTVHVYMQFTDGSDNNVGGIIHRVINVSMP